MATAASSYNVLIRVQAAQARREVRAFSAELAAAKRAAQGVGLGSGAQSGRTLASTNAQVTSSYRAVTKAAQGSTTAINTYAAATARAAAANRRMASTGAALATRTSAGGRAVAGRTSSAAADPAAASMARAGTAAQGAEAKVTALTAKIRTYSASAKVAARNTELLAVALGRLTPATVAATSAMAALAARSTVAGGAAAAAAGGIAAATTKASKAASAAESAGDAASSVLGDRMNRLRSLGASMTWAGRQVSMAFTLPFVLGAGAAVKWQMDVEKAATRMIKVYDDLGDGVLQITGADGKLTFNGSPMDRFLTALSNKMGQSKAELTEMAADWAQIGLTGGNVAAATKLTTEAMLLGDMEAAEAAEALIAIQAQYNLAFGDFNTERERAQRAAGGDVQAAREIAEANVTLTGVLAQLNMIENQTATSMNDLIIGFSRSAIFAKEAGVGAEYLGAHLAALIPATGTAERAGNALKTIYASLSTDKSKPQIAALENLALSAGLAADAFTSTEFRSRGMQQGIEDIASAYSKLDGATKLQWGKDVFGIYQMVRGMHLLDDVARGLGDTFTEDGRSISILAAQFATLRDEGARSAFILREFGIDGSEVETITDAVTGAQKLVNVKEDLIAQLEREAAATSDVSYYRQALSGQDSSKIYEQYSQEIERVLSSNPQMLKQAWVIVQNSMMKAIVPMIPMIVGFAQTIAKVAQAFGNLDPRWQKLIIYAMAFLAIIGPLSILLGSTILMFALVGKSLIVLGGAFGLVGGKAKVLGAAIRGLIRLLSGGRLFAPVASGAKAAGNAVTSGVTKPVLKLGPRLFGMFKTIGLKLGPMLWTGLKSGLGLLARFGPTLLKVITGPVGMVIGATLAILKFGGVGITDMFRTFFSGVGTNVKELLYDGDIPIFARPFVAGIEIITKTLSNIPDFVAQVFTGVYRAIARAAKGIYEMFSYINPFARHSPSLVENVTAGMAIVTKQFAVAGASISGTMRAAYADISAFGSKTAGLRIRAEEIEVGKQRQVVSEHAPDALPEFDRLTSARGTISAELERVNGRVKAQEQVVKRAQSAVDAYDRSLEGMNRSLEMTQRRMDGVQKSLDAAQKQYDYFASANIAGLSAMEDQLFANEMAQKRLQLAMKDAGADELEKTSDTLAKIAGQIDDLAASRDDLRLAGAGSDILGTYDSQIAGLRGQQQGLMDPASNSIASMASELEKLEQQAERMELEKSLQFDPLTRQVERFKETAATLPFEQIMAGMASSGAQVGLYQGQVDSLNASMDTQRAAITAVEDSRYAAEQASRVEQETLTALTESQTELSTAISDIDSALQLAVDSVEKYTASLEEAKRASDDLAGAGGGVGGGVGGAGDIGEGFGLADDADMGGAIDPPGMPDIESMIAEMESGLASAFDGINLFPSFDGLKNKIATWWDETVMQWFRDLPGNLGNALNGLVDGTFYVIGFIFGSIERMSRTLAEKGEEYIGLIFNEVKTWPGRLWEWFQAIDWSAIDWGHILRTIFKIFTPGFWTEISTELWEKMKPLAKDAWDGFVQGFMDIMSGIGNWVMDHIVNPFLDGFKRGFDMHSPSRVMIEFGADVVRGFFGGLADSIHLILTWARELPGKVFEALGNAKTWLVDKGRDIVRGLLDGAGEILPQIGEFFVGKLPGWIQEPFKKALGIESPSKVFAGYGHNIGEGLILGIEKMHSSVAAAGSDLANSAIPDRIDAPAVAAVQPVAGDQDPFAGLAADAQQTLPQVTQIATDAATQMSANYTGIVSGMQGQVIAGQQAHNLAYAAGSAALSAHTILTAQSTTVATVAAAQSMAASTIATAQSMAAGTTSATTSMAAGVTSSTNLMAAGVVGAMSNMAGQVSGIISGQVAPAIGSFDPMLAAATGWFGSATDNIGTIWAGVGPKTADPARFVINEVYDTGLRGAWNSFNEFLGIKELPSHRASFASGGVMPGYTPGRDVHQFVSPTGGRLELSGGEAIMRPEWTKAIGGPGVVAQLNAAARGGTLEKMGEQRANAFASGGVMSFANGGVVGAMDRIVKMKYPQMVLTSGLDARPGNHGLGLAADFAWPGAYGNHPAQLSLARDIAKTYPNSMELIYDSPGWAGNIKNGANVGAFGQFYTMAQAGDHSHHVHWAMNTPPTMPFGGGVFLGGSDGGGAGGFSMDWGQYIGDAFKQAMDPIRDKAPKFDGGIGQWIPKSIDKIDLAKDFLVKKAEEMTEFQGSIDDASGMVERWRPMMKAALIKQGLAHWANDPAILDRFMRQIDHESKGVPNVTQGIQDINSGGNEAEGLGQIAKGTWAGFHDPSIPGGWHDPWANLNTMARYVRGRYGPQGYLSIGNGIGYDSGGWLPPTPGGSGTFFNHTGKPEAVLTSEQWNAIYRSSSAGPTNFVAANIDLARRVEERLSSTFTPPVLSIMGAAREQVVAAAAEGAQQRDFWTSFDSSLEAIKGLVGEAKGIHEAVLTAVDETNELLESDEKLAEVAKLVTEAMHSAFEAGGELPREQIDALTKIATEYFAPVVELATIAIQGAQSGGKGVDTAKINELAEASQASLGAVSKMLSSWGPVVTSLTSMAGNIADLKQINLGAWASYGSPGGFGVVLERGLTHLANIGISTFNLAKNVLPPLVAGAFNIGKTVVDFAAENGTAVAAIVTAVATGNPLAALSALPQILSLVFDLLPTVISVIQNVVPNLIKGIANLIESFIFGSSSVYAYETREAAERAVAENMDAIRKGTFRPGQDVQSGTLTPGAQGTNVTINGNVVLPNVKGPDAKKFVTNLENLG